MGIEEVDTAKGPQVLQEVGMKWCQDLSKALVRMIGQKLLGPPNMNSGLPRAPETFDYLAVACDGESMGWRGGDGRPPTGAKGEDELLADKRLMQFASRATPRSAAYRLRPVPVRLLSVRGVSSGAEPSCVDTAGTSVDDWDETREAGGPDLLELRFEVADPALTLAPHFGVAGFLGSFGEPQSALRNGGQLGLAGGLAPGDAVGLLLPEPKELVEATLALLAVSPDAEVPAPAFLAQEYPRERMLPSFHKAAQELSLAMPSGYLVPGAGESRPEASFVLRELLAWDTTEGNAPFEGRASLPDAEVPRRAAYANATGAVPDGLPKAPLPPVVDSSPGSVRQREVCRIGDGLGKLWKLSSAQPQLLEWCKGCLQLHAARSLAGKGQESVLAAAT